MEIIRTPEDRFANLEDYPFAPNYIEIKHHDGTPLRFHYLDEGDPNGEIILCLHGQPSWSYLYRKMIPLLVAGGHRVIAPDMIGFGKSDKPVDKAAYTYSHHAAWVNAFLEALNLQQITLICQDWGALIGLRLVGLYPEKFARVVSSNGPLPSSKMFTPQMTAMLDQLYPSVPVLDSQGLRASFRQYDPSVFLKWIKYCFESPDFSVRAIMDMSLSKPSEAELDAYQAPFPDERYVAGARTFPSLVPMLSSQAEELAINDQAWEGLRQFEKPFITAFTHGDPITAGGEKPMIKYIPGAADQAHTKIDGGHFVQDDNPEGLSEVVLRFMEANPIV